MNMRRNLRRGLQVAGLVGLIGFGSGFIYESIAVRKTRNSIMDVYQDDREKVDRLNVLQTRIDENVYGRLGYSIEEIDAFQNEINVLMEDEDVRKYVLLGKQHDNEVTGGVLFLCGTALAGLIDAFYYTKVI